MTNPLDDPRRALAHKMAPVARQWRQLADDALAQFGVSNSAGWCLIHIDRMGSDVRQADLADALDIRQPSLVRTLDGLQASGFVARAAHPGDRRSNIITLTPAGRDLVGRIEQKLGLLRDHLLRDIPDEAIEIMVELLDLIGQRIAERRNQA